MAWLNKFKDMFNKKKRMLVIGLDGVPYSFLTHPKNAGKFPVMQALFNNPSATFKPMNSVIPTISSVAWSTFMTGKNPAKHNIYGFIDRNPNPFDSFIPTGSNMQSTTLWQILSEAKKRVVVINVPVTYPPRAVNGVLVSCFLATNLEKAAYPPSVVTKLKEMGYRIDVDAWLARTDKRKFLEDLHLTLQKRFEVAFHFLETEDWDYFHLHVMGTDRINHFLLDAWERDDPQFGPEFIRYYQEIDAWLSRVYEQFVEPDPQMDFMVLSDHGFCVIKQEVFVNQWLREKGWLKFTSDIPKSLKEMHPETRAYSLIPGRVFLNVKGREFCGRIEPGKQYEEIREELKEALMEIKDPDRGETIPTEVVKREEIYKGPYLERAADLIIVPRDGYDLKGNIDRTTLTGRSELVGMHTYTDAFFYLRGKKVEENGFDICDLAPTILRLMDVPVPSDMDRKGLTIS